MTDMICGILLGICIGACGAILIILLCGAASPNCKICGEHPKFKKPYVCADCRKELRSLEALEGEKVSE